MCGRFLADLGADVIRVEPPSGAESRVHEPVHEGTSLRFALQNAASGALWRTSPRRLVVSASWVCWTPQTSGSRRPGPAHSRSSGLDVDLVRARNRRLVVLSITGFGQTGPYRDWVTTDWTLLAMGGVLSRSGLAGPRPQLRAPGRDGAPGDRAAGGWAALVAYWNRLVRSRRPH